MLYQISIFIIAILFLLDRDKTIKGLKLGFKKLTKNLAVFLNMIILVAISLYFISDELIINYLGNGNYLLSLVFAILVGSISFMPGFIAFPLAGVLLDKGVSYTVLASFTTTMMMVGILTYPIEKEFFGHKVAITRNLVGLVIALIVSAIVAMVYGEVKLI
ncbi:permease [Orenia marismortui]|uniref:permease n=1 Tax=Orenia marismortui TaxID=46469 RepID=UPI000372DB10|nr:permease [Orenia marismortui]